MKEQTLKELRAQILEEAQRAYEGNVSTERGNGEVSPDVETVRKVVMDMSAHGYVHTQETLEAVERYLAFGRRVGVWLSGPNGVGKSRFFDVIEDSLKRLEIPRPDLFALHFSELAFWKLEDVRMWLDRVRDRDVLLDDVGIEPTGKDWGVKFEVLPIIIDNRMGCNCRTHFTSNLDRKAITERYKLGTFDRMRTLAKRIPIVATSKRRDGVRCDVSQLETWPPLPSAESAYRCPTQEELGACM